MPTLEYEKRILEELDAEELETAIELRGGYAVKANCPAVIDQDLFQQMTHQINFYGLIFTEFAIKNNYQFPGGIIALVNSPSFGCRVQTLSTKHTLITVPIGILGRLVVLSRLLLSYWGSKEPQVKIIRSPVDSFENARESIPELLRPLFLEEGGKDYWHRLEQLNDIIVVDKNAEGDVIDLVAMGLLYILSHEFAHITHGHIELLDRMKRGELQGDLDKIKRGIEVDADYGAVFIALTLQNRLMQIAEENGQNVNMYLGWFRLSYVVTMIFAIADSDINYFDAFTGSYKHPMVRCELYFWFSDMVFSGLDENYIKTWRDASSEGWKYCLEALEYLALDALKGKFGKVDASNMGTIHNLCYSVSSSGATNIEMKRHCRSAWNDMCEVQSYLPYYTKANALQKFPEKSKPTVIDRCVVGIFGADEPVIKKVVNYFGKERVVVLPQDFLSPEKNGTPSTDVEYSIEMDAENFMDKITHIIIDLDRAGIAGISVFSLSMIYLEKNRILSVNMLANEQSEKNIRDQVRAFSEIGTEKPIEELEAEGKFQTMQEFNFESYLKFVQSVPYETEVISYI